MAMRMPSDSAACGRTQKKEKEGPERRVEDMGVRYKTHPFRMTTSFRIPL